MSGQAEEQGGGGEKIQSSQIRAYGYKGFDMDPPSQAQAAGTSSVRIE